MSDNQNPPKDQTMLRHHLIFQNMLNNISLAIKNNQCSNVSITGLVINENEIKIKNITFNSDVNTQ